MIAILKVECPQCGTESYTLHGGIHPGLEETSYFCPHCQKATIIYILCRVQVDERTIKENTMQEYIKTGYAVIDYSASIGSEEATIYSERMADLYESALRRTWKKIGAKEGEEESSFTEGDGFLIDKEEHPEDTEGLDPEDPDFSAKEDIRRRRRLGSAWQPQTVEDMRKNEGYHYEREGVSFDEWKKRRRKKED